MMKGYLTVFLSLSLSILSGVILTLTALAIRNGQRLRMECIADISMNSALAEFEKTLHDRYGGEAFPSEYGTAAAVLSFGKYCIVSEQ